MRRKLGLVLMFCLMCGGCIRLQASAWHQGAEDETAKVHEVALDTRELVNKDAYQPDIQMPAA